MRIDIDHAADAAYIHIADGSDGPITSTVELGVPEGVPGHVIADFVGANLVGIEIVGVAAVTPGLVATQG